MKTIRGGGLLLLVLVCFALLIVIAVINIPSRERGDTSQVFKVPPSTGTAFELLTNGRGKFGIMAARLTTEEKGMLSKRFEEQFKPVLEKWCAAYAGRVPFAAKDVTIDKLHSILGTNSYTFIIGDTKLTIETRDFVCVRSMERGAYIPRRLARSTNEVIPEASLPITKEELIRMVKLDTEVDYKPNQCFIEPSGATGALSGSVFYEVIPHANYGIRFAFGKDGKMLSYYEWQLQ